MYFNKLIFIFWKNNITIYFDIKGVDTKNKLLLRIKKDYPFDSLILAKKQNHKNQVREAIKLN